MASRLENASELAEPAVDVVYVVEHPRGDHGVEGVVGERQGLHVSDACVETARSGKLHHPLGLVDERDVAAKPIAQARGKPTVAATDLEHAPGLHCDERLPENHLGVRAVQFTPERLPGAEVVLLRVLLADELRVVELPPHGSTISWPGSRFGGALPPSHAFTVAPTSANSPSWIRPAAFLPCT